MIRFITIGKMIFRPLHGGNEYLQCGRLQRGNNNMLPYFKFPPLGGFFFKFSLEPIHGGIKKHVFFISSSRC